MFTLTNLTPANEGIRTRSAKNAGRAILDTFPPKTRRRTFALVLEAAVPAYTLRDDDPESVRVFVATLGRRDPKTVAAYLTTLRDLVAWLATQPDGSPFRPDRLTVTALEGYFAHLVADGRQPRTRARALTAISCFCRWAIADGQLARNPAHAIERPTVPTLTPTELTPDQRSVLKTLVERQESPRLAAIFALGYWAGLRISEAAQLRFDHGVLNQRAAPPATSTSTRSRPTIATAPGRGRMPAQSTITSGYRTRLHTSRRSTLSAQLRSKNGLPLSCTLRRRSMWKASALLRTVPPLRIWMR